MAIPGLSTLYAIYKRDIDRDIEEMMAERGISVDHSTLNRWEELKLSP